MNFLTQNEPNGCRGLSVFIGMFFENVSYFLEHHKKHVHPEQRHHVFQETCICLPQHHIEFKFPRLFTIECVDVSQNGTCFFLTTSKTWFSYSEVFAQNSI